MQDMVLVTTQLVLRVVILGGLCLLSNNNVHTTTVEENESGDLYITLDPSVLNQLGWTEETLLEWELYDNGTARITATDA